MKTSVKKLYFDWQDPNTGESPKSYQIQVSAPGSEHNGDLMTHRLMKLLREHGDEVVNFPKTLLTEIYEDCCCAFAGYLLATGILEHLGEASSFDLYLRNYAHISTDRWIKLAYEIIKCMRLRVLADAGRYLEMFIASIPDDSKNAITCDERIVKANEEYAASGDLILDLEDQSLMPEFTLILLGLRRSLWRAFWQNALACSSLSTRQLDHAV